MWWGSHVENISKTFKAAVCLSPLFVCWLVGFGFWRACVIYSVTCVATYFDDILGKGRISCNNSLVLEILSFAVLGV